MSKQCEIDYFRAIGIEGQRHAMRKPFSDESCANNLVQFGVILRLLPPPPARVLDIGCGTGWTSRFLGRRGYQVTGVDISADMVQAADLLRREEGLENVNFREADYETLSFDEEFEAVLFYDSLHHALDETKAVQSAHRALVPGGVCITSEPGIRHGTSTAARSAVAQFGVTEKSMHPRRIIGAGRTAGFDSFRVWPNASGLARAVFGTHGEPPEWTWSGRLSSALRFLKLVLLISRTRTDCDGIVCMSK